MKLPRLGAGLWGLLLAQAPLLLEAAQQVAEHVRSRRARAQAERDGVEVPPERMTLAELGAEVGRLRERLREADAAQAEQAALLRRLAEQNRALALAAKGLGDRYRLLLGAGVVLALAVAGLAVWMWRHSAR